jgi:hypothetical protein
MTGPLLRGSYLFSGLLSLSSSGGDIHAGAYGIGKGNRINLTSINPSISYFLADNMGIGMDFLYTRDWFDEFSTARFAFIPRFTYAIPMEGDLRPYLNAGVGLMRWNFYQEGEYSEVGMTVKTGFGWLYLIHERYATTMEVGYRWDRFDPEGAVYPITGNSISFAFGLSGFYY